MIIEFNGKTGNYELLIYRLQSSGLIKSRVRISPHYNLLKRLKSDIFINNASKDCLRFQIKYNEVLNKWALNIKYKATDIKKLRGWNVVELYSTKSLAKKAKNAQKHAIKAFIKFRKTKERSL